ncbi:filaggrin-2 isoform X2 [Fopius arisanus]|uniref:Filaggrin-2 isoform X2 n=1 Tax=Fopius arisanus TaxID=64838 RepID=A0A9R1T9J2_9HYME|nr:PREDICTED: filaggrin-2-like isoform X2 [Fopius arisanus]
MALKLAVIICAVVAQALGAPKPCYSNCGTSGSTFSHETMTGVSTHGNFMTQQNAAFQQLHQSLMNQLQEAHHLDYSQPGTWHKNAAYKTEDGGQVYQEHGKVETDNSQMRYFKKNYTNSWGTGSGGLGNDLLQERLTGDRLSGGSSHQEHHQNWEINSNGHHSQNIEDLSVHQVPTTQVSQTVLRNFEDMARNLESYISQCTERVQMGQLSNYQSYTDVVQQHLDQMKQAVRDNGLWNRLIGQINSLETKLNELKVQAQHSANLVQSGTKSHGTVISTAHQSGHQSAHQSAHQSGLPQAPVGASINRDEEYQRRVSVTSSHPAQVQSIPSNNQYVSGTSGGYQHSYQYGSHGQSGYASGNQDVSSGTSQHADYTQHSGYGQHGGRYTQHSAGGYTHDNARYDQGSTGYHQGSAGYGQHDARYNQHNAGYNQLGSGYNQHSEQVYPVHTSPTKTVEENWNSSGSRKETTYGTSHVLEPIRSVGGRCRGADGQYSTWCPSNSGQVESINYGGQGSGCHGAAYGTLCKRYKREIKDDLTQQTEDLTQQTEDLTQQTEDLTQQTGDLTQQTEDLTQQTRDLTQQSEDLGQHAGGLQVGNQNRNREGYRRNGQDGINFNQQSGGIEFGGQERQRQDRNNHRGHGVHGHEQHGHNDGDQDYTQQTQGPGDFSQQYPHGHGHRGHGTHGHEQHGHNDGDFNSNQQGQLNYSQQDFGGNWQLGQQRQQVQQTGGIDFGQQTEDLSRQTGNLNIGNQQSDLSQQTQSFDDWTQQTTGNLGFGQQQSGSLQEGNSGGYGDYNQHTHSFGELNQQTTGDFGFGRQETGNLEFGNQRGNSGQYRDFGQQTSGSLDFGQQTEDLSQQTQSFGDFGQQTTGNLGFGQQTEDLSQQTQSFGGLTQQTSGSLDFGQQTEDLSQQTQSFGDFGQQTTGNLGFGQQTEDLSQQTQSFGDFDQQTTGNHGFGQQTEDLSQQTQSFGDFTQQTTGDSDWEPSQKGKLELGDQHQDWDQQIQSFPGSTQQSGTLELGNERPAPKPPARGRIRNGGPTPAAQDTPLTPVKGGAKRPAQQNTYPQSSQNPDPLRVIPIEDQFHQSTQWHNSHQPGDLTNENYQQGPLEGSQKSQSPRNEQQNSTDTEILFQPRILEAYGGNGPYDVNHNDNIFAGVKPNPTATLSPMSDSWDIQEKPNELARRNNNYPTFAGAPDRTPGNDWEETTPATTTAAPGFWKRVGNKIATTYEKTKEKISDTFG